MRISSPLSKSNPRISSPISALFVSKISKPEIAKKYMTIIVNMKTVVSRRIFMRTEDNTIARSGLWITPKR